MRGGGSSAGDSSQLSGAMEVDGEPGEGREVVTYKKWGRGYKKIRTVVYGEPGEGVDEGGM